MTKIIKIQLVFLFLLIFSNASSQDKKLINSKIDSLFIELNKSNEDTFKIKLLIEIGDKYKNSMPDTALFYYQKALNISKNNSEKFLTALSLRYIGIVLKRQGFYSLAKEYYLQALKIYESLNNKEGMSLCYNYIGNVYLHQGSYDKAIEYYYVSLEINEKLEDKGRISDCYNNIGTVHYNQGSYDKGIEYFLKSLKIKKELEDKENVSICYNNIGAAYFYKRNYDKAVEYYHKSLKIEEELLDKRGVAQCYVNIGEAHLFQDSFKVASEYYLIALKIFKELDNNIGIIETYNYITSLNIRLANSSNFTEQQKINCLNKAVEYGNKSFELAKVVDLLPLKKVASNNLMMAHNKLGNYEKAIQFAEKFISIQDSLFSVEKMKVIENLEAKYQAEKKQVQIDNLEAVNQIQSQNLKTLRSRQILLFLLLIVFVSFMITLLYIRKKLKVNNKTIYKQNETIKEQYHEIKIQNEHLDTYKNHLEAIVDEKTEALKIALEKAKESDNLKTSFLDNLSHEIRTPMNAVLGYSNLLASKNEGLKKEYTFIQQNFIQLLNLIDDIMLLSELQTMQYKFTKTEISLNELMSEIESYIIDQINKENKPIEVFLNIDSKQDIKIKTDKELLNKVFYSLSDNAVKYTDQGRIEFGYNLKNDNLISFYIKDSGIGIDENEFPNIYEFFRKIEGKKRLFRGTGIGLAIVKKSCELLEAEISIKSEKNKGTEFAISMKK